MNSLIKQIIIFFVAFAVIYFGFHLMNGLASPESYYSPFIDKHLDLIEAMKRSLLYGTKYLMGFFGFDVTLNLKESLAYTYQGTILLGRDCYGFGVFSFWLAFIISSKAKLLPKLLWSGSGVLLLYFINVVRISLTLATIQNKNEFPLGLDNHFWFNVMAYGAIFTMIYFFEKKRKKDEQSAA